MASKKVSVERKIDFLNNIILKPHTIRVFQGLLKSDKSYGQLKVTGPVRLDKNAELLAIYKKYKNEEGIVLCGLTVKGKKLAEATLNLLKEIEEFLPEED